MTNPAREALTRAVNRAIANGAPVYVNQSEEQTTMTTQLTTTQRLTVEGRDFLEHLLDSTSLAEMLNGLEQICSLKAQHLAENWQDEASAKAWERAAVAVDQCMRKAVVEAVSFGPHHKL